MKSKGLIFTYILLAIALVEGLIVVYDLLKPAAEKTPLATAELSVPARQLVVPPMLFEQHFAERVAQELDEMISAYANKAAFLEQTIGEAAPKNGDDVTNDEAFDAQATPMEKTAEPLAEQKANRILSNDKKYIAIVIDDLGVSPQYTKDILSLNKPLTAAFLPYAPANKKQVQQAKDAGFEVMLHVPMMPHHRAALAPVTLAPEMDKATIQKHLRAFMKYYDGTGMMGINNHMGSEFTENAQSLGYVMEILKENGWFFLDSKTTGKSAGKQVATQYGVPYIARDVFLDNEEDYNYIMGQLQETENVAQKYGRAVAIGHPHRQTYAALRDWLATVEERGFVLVHLSDLLE